MRKDFERIRAGECLYFIKKQYKDLIFDDLKTDFKGVSKFLVFSGRGKSFNYGQFFVKNYTRGGLVSILGNIYFGYNRALNEMEVDRILARKKFPSPRLIAIKIKRRAFFYNIVGVYERIDAKTLPEYLDQKSPINIKTMLVCLSKILKELIEAGIYHSDLNLNNILVKGEGENMFLVDFDKAVIKGKIREQDEMKMVSRLYRSCKKLNMEKRGFATTDFIRFLRLYAGNDKVKIKKYLRKAMVDLKWHRLLWRER